ncbi:MAG: pilus assembly protein TadG-related protein [Bryobacteraceae bacterium]|jgi:Flp pilus assembly protein TadG
MRTHTSSRRGQALIMIVLSCLVIFGAVGLVVDLGWARFRKQAAQAAAESAALAAAASAASTSCTPSCAGTIGCQAATACPTSISTPPSNNLLAGCLYASANGFKASGHQNVTIAANVTAPPSVPNVTVPYWVSVSVSETIPQLFSAVFGNTYLSSGAHVTAAVLPSTSSGGCIYVLAPSGSSVTNSGSALLQSGCGIYIDSSSSSAVLMSGSATIKTTGTAKTNIVGNWLASGGATITPAPNLGISPQADPFASMPAPTVGSCTYTSPVVITTNTTLSQGTYCGGIITSGTETITMNPGLYIIKSGITESGSPTFNGTGVTLYFNTGGITGSGTGGFNLSAPTTGTYQGVVLFEDRSDSSGITLSGSTGTQVSGLVYMPKGNLTYSGDSGTSGVVSTLVVNAITFSGSSYIQQAATTAYGGGSGSCPVALIE